MGAGADILARLDEIEAKLDRLLAQRPLVERGAGQVIAREAAQRERRLARENWVREHLPEFIDELGADPWATWAIAELERDGLEVTPPSVRRLRAARVAALDA